MTSHRLKVLLIISCSALLAGCDGQPVVSKTALDADDSEIRVGDTVTLVVEEIFFADAPETCDFLSAMGEKVISGQEPPSADVKRHRQLVADGSVFQITSGDRLKILNIRDDILLHVEILSGKKAGQRAWIICGAVRKT